MAREKRATVGRKTYAEVIDSDGEQDDVPVASTSMGKGRARKQVDDDFDEDDAELEPPTKRAKRAPTKGKGRGRVGKLAAFNEMPLDVLGEICSHLDPLSLLYMSRTTKSIRQLLTSKGSRALWISARRTVALHDLDAEDVTEMQYASLVFERNCMVCGKPRAKKVDYAIRARYCQPCQKANVLYESRMGGAVTNLHALALSCSPLTLVSTTGRFGRNHFFVPQVQKMSDRLHALELEHRELKNLADSDDDAPSTGKKGKGKGKAKVVTKGKGRVVARPAPAVEGESAETDDADETPFERFVRTKQAAVAKCSDDAKLIFKWERTSVQDRQAASTAAAQSRAAAIDVKMIALGYDVRDVHGNRNHKIYYDGKELTERIWSKISPQIIATTVRTRDYRLQSEARARCVQRRSLIDPLYQALAVRLASQDLNCPTGTEFENLASVKPFWEPEGVTISPGEWTAALPAIKADIVQHQVTTKRQYFAHLATMLHVAGSPIDTALATAREVDSPIASDGKKTEIDVSTDITDAEMDAIFAHFSSRFLCSLGCKVLLPFEGTCRHRRSGHGKTEQSFYDDNDEVRMIKLLDEVRMIKLLLSTLAKEGFDETATDADLDQLGPVFECYKCPAAKDETGNYETAAMYRSAGYWGGGGNGAAAAATYVPLKTADFLWSEALKHFVKHHSTQRYWELNRRTPVIKRMSDEPDREQEAIELKKEERAAAMVVSDDEDFGAYW